MNFSIILAQVIIFIGIYNVWFFRFSKNTAWRGKNAKNMTEEFAVYGLPKWSVFVIGFLKVLSATMIFLGIFIPLIAKPFALILSILMFGAILMHIKVKDNARKSLPAFIMFLLSLFVYLN